MLLPTSECGGVQIDRHLVLKQGLPLLLFLSLTGHPSQVLSWPSAKMRAVLLCLEVAHQGKW
jgi:hypothetical protein